MHCQLLVYSVKLVLLGVLAEPRRKLNLSPHPSGHELSGNDAREHGLDGQEGPGVVGANRPLDQVAVTEAVGSLAHKLHHVLGVSERKRKNMSVR